MNEPPGFGSTHLERARQDVVPHDHAVFAYDTQEELRSGLSAFIDEGEHRGELSVFVHAFESDDAAWAFVNKAISKETAAGLIVVSLYKEAFEGEARRIDHEHVGRVVDGLQQKAREANKRGVRIFVDASRAYFAGSRVSEWFEFENWLGRRLQAKLGLVCAYQRADIMNEEILPQVLHTHAYRFDAPKGRK